MTQAALRSLTYPQLPFLGSQELKATFIRKYSVTFPILHILEYKFVIENPEKGYKCHF